jgi:hypothetical protein
LVQLYEAVSTPPGRRTRDGKIALQKTRAFCYKTIHKATGLERPGFHARFWDGTMEEPPAKKVVSSPSFSA